MSEGFILPVEKALLVDEKRIEVQGKEGGTKIQVEGGGEDIQEEEGGADIQEEGGTEVQVEGGGAKIQVEGGGAEIQEEGGTEVQVEEGGTEIQVEVRGADIQVEGGGADIKEEVGGTQIQVGEEEINIQVEIGGTEVNQEEMGVSSDNGNLVLYSKETLVAVESEITEFRFLCNVPGCGKSFKRRSVHNEHLAVHTGHRGFKCDECDLTFFTSNQKYKHKESFHGVNKCSICDKQFSNKSNLFYHIEKQHKKKFTGFPCIHCSSIFSQKSDLTKHMKSHSGSVAFNCSICGKTFAYKNSLRRHEKIHLDEKFHSCDICDQKFIQKCDLTKHNETHGNSRFKCKVCNQVYSRKDSLARHSRLHRLNLSCPVESCWDRFPSKHSLMAHLRTDHNRLEVEPVMTSLTFIDRPEEEDPEIVDNPEPVDGSSLDQGTFIQSSQDILTRSNENMLLDIDTMALENAGIFVDKTCLFNLKDDLDVDLSTGEALVNESVLQSIQRERELEEHKFVIAE